MSKKNYNRNLTDLIGIYWAIYSDRLSKGKIRLPHGSFDAKSFFDDILARTYLEDLFVYYTKNLQRTVADLLNFKNGYVNHEKRNKILGRPFIWLYADDLYKSFSGTWKMFVHDCQTDDLPLLREYLHITSSTHVRDLHKQTQELAKEQSRIILPNGLRVVDLVDVGRTGLRTAADMITYCHAWDHGLANVEYDPHRTLMKFAQAKISSVPMLMAIFPWLYKPNSTHEYRHANPPTEFSHQYIEELREGAIGCPAGKVMSRETRAFLSTHNLYFRGSTIYSMSKIIANNFESQVMVPFHQLSYLKRKSLHELEREIIEYHTTQATTSSDH